MKHFCLLVRCVTKWFTSLTSLTTHSWSFRSSFVSGRATGGGNEGGGMRERYSDGWNKVVCIRKLTGQEGGSGKNDIM